jgi:predicted TIM-barrel fold metal-dependent hydrolase
MIIDVNVSLSRWPFRRLPFDETARLVDKLREHQITQAWAGSLDALLHRDIASVNARLVTECQQHGGGILRPVGSVNPALPDWQEDLRRCHEEHRMHAIRLHPNYHGYKLDVPECDELWRLAGQRRMIVQLVMKMEDVRTHHPLMQVPTVDPQPLATLVQKHPRVRLIVMNNDGTLRGDVASQLSAAGQVYFEISHAEQIGALEKLVQQVPQERLLFGSHFPLFNLEAALFKFRESQLGGFATANIQRANAERLMAQE